MKPNTPPDLDDIAEILAYRKQIDAIDDQLIRLFMERIGIVSKVGEIKRKAAPGQCPIRAGREAQQVRRIMSSFENTAFPPAAAAAIWRIIIGASTAVEAPLTLSVFIPDRDNELYWMAREYFGPTAAIIKQPHIKRVIGDVMDSKAAVGIVPMLRSADTTYWWTNLMEKGTHIPKIFARIPFLAPQLTGMEVPSALAIARIKPELSGDDCSLVVIEADHNVSQHRLQTAFITAKLEATWINIATLSPNTRHHLIEIKGFVTHGHEGFESLLSTMRPSIMNVTFLGAYATPITFNAKKANDAGPAAA